MAEDTELFWPSLYSRLVPHRYGSDEDVPQAIRQSKTFQTLVAHGLSQRRAKQWIIVSGNDKVDQHIARMEQMRNEGELEGSPADELLAAMTDELGEERRDEEDFEAPEHFLTDFRTLRHHIETDLISLLNATCLEAALNIGKGDPVIDHGDFATLARDKFPLAAYPMIRRSVVNFGLPSMIGKSIYRLRIEDLENELREAILAYEPRLTKLRVRVDRRQIETSSGPEETDEIDPERPISFDIQAEVLGKGEVIQVLISTVWDLEKVESRAQLVS